MSSIVVLNMSGDVLYANKKARHRFQIPASGNYGNNLIKTVLACNEEKFHEIEQRILSGQGFKIEQTEIIDGVEKIFFTSVEPLSENDIISVVVIISSDISELVEAREQAITANTAKNQFLANMSHELRTPMIGILGSVDLLEQSKLNHEQVENVEIIRDCGEQLLDIINGILNLSKIELGLVNLNLEPCNLLNVFSRVTKIINPLLSKKGLSLKLDIPANMPVHVMADQTKLYQIISNILYNAVKFTNKGEVKFKASIQSELNQQSWLHISITDTGIGISHEQMEEIFEPFTQVDNSTSRNFEGTGLGLYICKKLLDLMNGHIWVNSNQGSGTVFHFKIPVEIISDSKTVHTQDSDISEQYQDDLLLAFNPRKILIVEDNKLNQKIVSQMLSAYGFEVSSVSNGLECLNILQEKSFDVILMDIQMPVMDGYETSRFIKEDSSLNHIPVIAMTAHAMLGDQEKCLAAGCASYIAKPFKAEELVEEIKKHLNKKCVTRKKAEQHSTAFIAELIPEFMDLLSEMIANLDAAVEKGDFKTIQNISHDIKGTAGMYGFMKISEKAALIEQAARINSREKIIALTGQLHYLFKQVNIQVS